MKNEQLEGVKAHLRKIGVKVPDREVQEIIRIVESTSSVVYEVGDFIEYNAGMGEVGYGQICTGRSSDGKSYNVLNWTHDEVGSPSYRSTVAASDVFRLSSASRAQIDYNERRIKR